MKTKWNLELGKLLHRPALQPDEIQNKAINDRVNVICFFLSYWIGFGSVFVRSPGSKIGTKIGSTKNGADYVNYLGGTRFGSIYGTNFGPHFSSINVFWFDFFERKSLFFCRKQLDFLGGKQRFRFARNGKRIYGCMAMILDAYVDLYMNFCASACLHVCLRLILYLSQIKSCVYGHVCDVRL